MVMLECMWRNGKPWNLNTREAPDVILYPYNFFPMDLFRKSFPFTGSESELFNLNLSIDNIPIPLIT